jgi:hypothetical protein
MNDTINRTATSKYKSFSIQRVSTIGVLASNLGNADLHGKQLRDLILELIFPF